MVHDNIFYCPLFPTGLHESGVLLDLLQFCCNQIWLAWRRSTKQPDLLVGNGFVAVNSELHDSFTMWQSRNPPWTEEDDGKTWIPYNEAVQLWWDATRSEPAILKTMYSCTFISLTLADMKELLDYV